MKKIVTSDAAFNIDAEGAIVATAWTFGRPDSRGDEILPGAIRNVAPDLPMLFRHDPEQPIGHWHEVIETATGIEVHGRLDLTSRTARSVRSLIASGRLSGVSLGFYPVESRRNGRGETYSAIDVFEVSIAKNPANKTARIARIKTHSLAAEINAALRRAISTINS